MAVKNPGTLKKPANQKCLGLAHEVYHRLNCSSRSKSSLNQNPNVLESQETCTTLNYYVLKIGISLTRFFQNFSDCYAISVENNMTFFLMGGGGFLTHLQPAARYSGIVHGIQCQSKRLTHYYCPVDGEL